MKLLAVVCMLLGQCACALLAAPNTPTVAASAPPTATTLTFFPTAQPTAAQLPEPSPSAAAGTSSHLLYYLRDTTVFTWDTEQKTRQSRSVLNVQGLYGAVLSPDGRYLSFSDRSALSILDLATDTIVFRLSQQNDADQLTPRAFNSNQQLLIGFTDAAGAQRLKLLTFLEGTSLITLPLPVDVSSLGCDTGISWSPANTRFALTGLGYGLACNVNPGLTLVDSFGSLRARVITRMIMSGVRAGQMINAGARTPAWAPDGTFLVFSLDEDALAALQFPARLYRVLADGSGLAPLTANNRGVAAYPFWPTMDHLYYSLSGDSPQTDGIYRLSFPDLVDRLLVEGPGLCPVSISPDEDSLIYGSGCQSNGRVQELHLLDLDSGQTEHLEISTGAALVFLGWGSSLK